MKKQKLTDKALKTTQTPKHNDNITDTNFG